jgi:predicted dehydrogenase
MTVGIAVIGSGAIARDHVRALAALDGVQVVTVTGSDPARAAAVAALAPGSRVEADAATAICDPDVQAVDVCGHTADHATWSIAAGRAGRHVMVEKPAALNLPDLERMIAATRTGSLLVGQTVRFQPAVAELQRQVADGAIGTPRLIHITWYVGHVWPGGWRGWQLDAARSGGHPVHNGTHAFDLVAWITGRVPRRVFARAFPSFAAQMDVPDSFHVTIRLDDGSIALVELSYALRQPGDMLRRLVVTGTQGTLVHSTTDDPGLVSASLRPPPASIDGAFDRQMRHWRDVVTGHCAPVTTAGEIRAALAGALAAQRSLATGRPEPVDTEPAGAVR